MYYTILKINKGNVKETWKIINSIINKKTKGTNISSEFDRNGKQIIGDKNIANGFNDLFTNIGPSL